MYLRDRESSPFCIVLVVTTIGTVPDEGDDEPVLHHLGAGPEGVHPVQCGHAPAYVTIAPSSPVAAGGHRGGVVVVDGGHGAQLGPAVASQRGLTPVVLQALRPCPVEALERHKLRRACASTTSPLRSSTSSCPLCCVHSGLLRNSDRGGDAFAADAISGVTGHHGGVLVVDPVSGALVLSGDDLGRGRRKLAKLRGSVSEHCRYVLYV